MYRDYMLQALDHSVIHVHDVPVLQVNLLVIDGTINIMHHLVTCFLVEPFVQNVNARMIQYMVLGLIVVYLVLRGFIP